MMNILNDAFPFTGSGYQENIVYDNAPDTFPNVSHVDYNSNYDKYNRLLRQVQTPLYHDSEHTVLATLGRDDESGPSEPTTDQLNEPYQEESPHVVPDTKDIRVNKQHVSAIIGYISITSSELNSLQRNPINHDDDGFIDDKYIEDDEYSDQIEEDDDSDDSDYHEY
ncbi:hypothetical protein ACLB2K_048059 [Fragaria x ananassa]